MTMLTDKEIDSVWERTASDSSYEFARAIIAAYQAKLRAGVELPKGVAYVRDADVRCFGAGAGESSFTFGRHKDWKHPLYTKDQLQQYGDARASVAEQRGIQAGYLRGLEDAKRVIAREIDNWDDDRGLYSCAAAIDRLKGGE